MSNAFDTEPQIVAFVCNWCAYASADLAGVSRREYPPNVRLIRVMCTGRLHPGLLLQAFLQGADGVLVSGCLIGDCHYLEGNVKCRQMLKDVWEILNRLGIEPQRLRLRWISAAEGARFAEEMRDFTRMLSELGKSPVNVQPEPDAPPDEIPLVLPEETPLLMAHQIEMCMECSICTGGCPVSRANPVFQPKQIIRQGGMQLTEEILCSRELWACLGCDYCRVRCPAGIDFPEMVRSYRKQAREKGFLPLESHHGIMQVVSRLQTRPLKQRRTAWAEERGELPQRGDYFYFVGCLPYFEVAFRHLNIDPLNSARAVLRLLRRIGIAPVVSPDECCCGHDALLSGDESHFLALARKNLAAIVASGAKTVLFSCPEGYATFNYDYPRYFGKLPFEAVHLTEFLAERVENPKLSFKATQNKNITYQDPCSLGRRVGLYDPPRRLLAAIPEMQLVEMERHRENGLCCGTSAWMECDRCSKTIQSERLAEAAQTGADTLITACPKCRIHLTCALADEECGLEIKDLYEFLGEHLLSLKA